MMKKKAKKRPLTGLVFQVVIRFFSCFSLKLVHRFGFVIGWCLWLLPNPLKRISTENINSAYPDYLPVQRKRLIRDSLIELGKGLCELGPLWCWPRQKLLPLVDDNGWQHAIGNALKQGRGVIILSPHLGAWELMGWYGSIFYPLTSLYRPPRVRSIADFMRQARQRDGARLVPTDVSGIKALFKALKKNETIGILPDQDPGKGGGVVAPFFNHPANTITLIPKLIQKTGAPVFFTFAERLAGGTGYKIHVVEAGQGLAAENELDAATALNQQIEQCVKLAPAQYLWSYGRYRKVKKHLRGQQQQ
jgi:KDO2-lipid IV(A) lauroyltransferase